MIRLRGIFKFPGLAPKRSLGELQRARSFGPLGTSRRANSKMAGLKPGGPTPVPDTLPGYCQGAGMRGVSPDRKQGGQKKKPLAMISS